ncbi:MAG TPA: hypothetical protein VHE78_15650, partial [Gemmatimonadaceae bacterium]|nr:hypothetical protein [Gemmatimonadaceae bacterium]
PATGREWEHVGVTPDIEVPGDSALRVAHVDAVRRMANRADGVRRAELTAIRDELTAKDAAQTVPVATLRQYAGNYGGGGIVAERNGRLRYAARPALPWVNLVHLSNAEFVAAGTRYIFDMDNGVPRLLLAEPGREPVAYVRLRTEQR